MEMTKRESDKIYFIKGIAIILVICAHCGGVTADAPQSCQIMSNYLATLGCLGVPLFFFTAGYVFQWKGIRYFVSHKFVGVLCPWVVTGTAVYLYVYLRKGGLSFVSWFTFLLGLNSYLWYMSVLLIVWIIAGIIFAWHKANKNMCMIISIILCAFVLLLEYKGIVYFHPYINPFRWFWIFALGVIASSKALFGKSFKIEMNFINLFLVCLMLLTILGMPPLSYREIAFFPIVFVLLTVAIFSDIKQKRLKKLSIYVGKRSFAIYLLHMPVAGITVNLLNRVVIILGVGGVLIRPVLVLTITLGCIWLFEKLCSRWPQMVILQKMIGLR